jgi:hypothetical protein
MLSRTTSNKPIPPAVPGMYLCPRRKTTESGELPHGPTAPNIALARHVALDAATTAPNIVSARPLALDAATTAPNIASAMPLASDAVTAVDLSPHDVDDDGFLMALSAMGMRTASPRGAVMVVGTPARLHNTYNPLRGLDQLVSSGKTRIEDSQPLYTPPEDTAPPSSPPLSLQQWGRG